MIPSGLISGMVGYCMMTGEEKCAIWNDASQWKQEKGDCCSGQQRKHPERPSKYRKMSTDRLDCELRRDMKYCDTNNEAVTCG